MEISYHISWRRNSGGGNCDSTTVANGNLLSGEGNLACGNGCSGTITAMSYICTDFSIEENWSFGERRITHNFTATLGEMITTLLHWQSMIQMVISFVVGGLKVVNVQASVISSQELMTLILTPVLLSIRLTGGQGSGQQHS